ncbi:hypothetical protein EJB05_51582, partial [Eragrostis curvula]
MPMAASTPQDQLHPSMRSKRSPKEEAPVLAAFLCFAVLCLGWIATMMYKGIIRDMDNKPVECSVELVEAKGLGRPAISPDAESPAIKLLVHVNNRHVFGMDHDGGSVVVSYAGVPLARGSTPAFFVGKKKTVTLAEDATSEGVGVLEDLLRLMLQERRSGVAQLEIDLLLFDQLYTCSVDLDGQIRAGRCNKLNIIYSS